MNKPVSLELKQLLYNKGWRYELSDDISETGSLYNNHSLAEERFNQNDISYVDITIADIIMWLYDKHELWIEVKVTTSWAGRSKTLTAKYSSNVVGQNRNYKIKTMISTKIGDEIETPQEAYIEAIKYCLNNKI